MLKACGLTSVGCGRSNNEDWFVLAADEQLCVVADGMGGAHTGEVAARLAVEAVLSHVLQSESRKAPTSVAAFNAAHDWVLVEEKYGAGSHQEPRDDRHTNARDERAHRHRHVPAPGGHRWQVWSEAGPTFD